MPDVQVDVRALKQTLWHGIGALQEASHPPCDSLSFQDILTGIAADNPAGRLEDLSVHLCFICVLHLANENGLRVTGVPGLDQMHVSELPSLATTV